MVRGKTQMKRIENATSRQVTFSKRRNGLLKKAFELSVLCEAEVALIIFSARGRLYEFSSSSMSKTIERYQKRVKEPESSTKQQGQHENKQHVKEDDFSMGKKIENLEASKRKLLGDGLGPCSIQELQQLESQLDRSLIRIRTRKNQLIREQIEKLKKQARVLADENSVLRKECGMPALDVSTNAREVADRESMEVETELYIGPPESRIPN
ncbi:agamous-like MADS-box protein AGL19 isoform X2 [Tripterygium wilfordii]|uniref:agamous-like MADS-box protein AGL19 isoform X2 n=1 Tax=Tripterygium wilfordii TaxID=458696 RepID=UPI0018F80DFA|nr:agamous-like MADS-box protein AGL19 isoform X2 [Tripterygium wilfordii]XP_038724971.1 agamous-like MADS-box protein AGL19 isoform X2 [Tripterygium wilfordii]